MTGRITMHMTMRGWTAVFALLTAAACTFSGASNAFAGSPHVRAGIDTASCAACHATHIATNSMLLRTGEASASVTASCLVCHNGSSNDASNIASGKADSFALPSGHTLNSAADKSAHVAGCETCHDTHGSSEDARRIPAKTVNGVEVSSADRELCVSCHSSSADWFGADYPSTSAPTRDATGYPVAGTWTGTATYESTSSAHGRIPESTRTVGVSEPVRREQGSCLYCHAAHGGANAYDGLLTTYTVPTQATLASDTADGSYAALCFGCHGGTKPSGFATAPVDIKQFATASGGTGGHSIVTSGGTLPVGAPLPCFECHNPHGSKRDNSSLLTDERGASLGTTSAAGVRQFCFTCHSTSDTTAGWDSETATFTAVASTDTVVGLPRDGAALNLTDTVGHSQEATASCYDCHGDDYGKDGSNVHAPADGSAGVFALAAVSLPTTSTVQTAALDASASLDASSSLDASGSLVASAGVDTTASVAATDAAGVPEFPVLPSDPGTGSLLGTDLTPPMTISDAVATYSVSATITLTAEDASGGAGVAETYWSLDGGELSTGTVVATSAVGSHMLTFWSVDLAGNVEPANTVEFTIESEQAMAFTPALAARRWWSLSGVGA